MILHDLLEVKAFNIKSCNTILLSNSSVATKQLFFLQLCLELCINDWGKKKELSVSVFPIKWIRRHLAILFLTREELTEYKEVCCLFFCETHNNIARHKMSNLYCHQPRDLRSLRKIWGLLRSKKRPRLHLQGGNDYPCSEKEMV